MRDVISRLTTNAFYQLALVEPQLHIECEPVPE